MFVTHTTTPDIMFRRPSNDIGVCPDRNERGGSSAGFEVCEELVALRSLLSHEALQREKTRPAPGWKIYLMSVSCLWFTLGDAREAVASKVRRERFMAASRVAMVVCM